MTTVPGHITRAVVHAFKQPWTEERRIPGTRPVQYETIEHIPDGDSAAMVSFTASDGYRSLRTLTFTEVLDVAYPLICEHVRATAASSPPSPEAATHRPGTATILADLADRAARDNDPVLAFAADALLRLHSLYPDADTLAARGTSQAQSRTDIHNTITDALVEHLPAITGMGATRQD